MQNRVSAVSMSAVKGFVLAAAVALLASQAHEANGARVLALLPHPGYSHFMVFEPLLDQLAANGHDLTVVSFFPKKHNPNPSKYHDISLNGIIDVFQEVIPLSMFEPSSLGLDRFQHLYMLDMLSSWAIDICDKMQKWPTLQPLYKDPRGRFDVVIVEMFNSVCLLGLTHAIGAPVVGITSHQDLTWWTGNFGQMDNPSYVPNILLPFDQHMSLSDRVVNTIMMLVQVTWFKWVGWQETNIVRKRFGASIPSLNTLRHSLALQLVNTHHSLNGRYERAPSTIEVGGLHLSRTSNATIPPDLEAIVTHSEPGVILFSLGSMVRSSTLTEERRNMILRVLARLSHTVVWKYEDTSAIKNVPPNVHLVPWLPQRSLLNHPKVVAFIAHGGLLGMTEAVDAGVPMIVIPFFGDQPGNAAAAAAAGLATVLPYRDLTESSLQTALQKVLSPEMRESAARLSRVWRDRPAPPLDTAVYWVERVARHGFSAPLHSPARDMPFYQLALLDVLAVCLLALVALLLTIFYIAKFIVYAVCIVVKRKTKEKIN